ncbi:hypothetical protein A1D31_38325 [Bradyrhizobium liaoningense]|nr:hypothetical protein A1D31_38325 [Bradyrhizobium liaoningense]
MLATVQALMGNGHCMDEDTLQALKLIVGQVAEIEDDDVFVAGTFTEVPGIYDAAEKVFHFIKKAESGGAKPAPMKIFWDESRGTVYWLEGDEVAFAPMNNDSTAALDYGGIVEVWSEDGAAAAEEKRVRAMLT